MRVLIVEDEQALADTVAEGLRAEGHDVVLAADGDRGFELGCDPSIQVIVLDIMLPKRNGFRVCRDLRAAGVATPVLMLTAKDGDLDEAEALDIGADDFLRKPFSFVVLEARLRALGRRSQHKADGVVGDRTSQLSASNGAMSYPGPGRVVRAGDLVVELGSRRCRRGTSDVTLTSRELDLLVALITAEGAVLGKADLLNVVWGPAFDGDPNIVEVYVGYLRRKVDVPFGRTSIQTVRGHGYRIDP